MPFGRVKGVICRDEKAFRDEGVWLRPIGSIAANGLADRPYQATFCWEMAAFWVCDAKSWLTCTDVGGSGKERKGFLDDIEGIR